MPKEPKPPKVKDLTLNPQANNGTFYKPETKGRYKKGPLDWSLDELIQYRQNGTPPARIPDAEILYKLGKCGVSLSNACEIFGISKEKFSSNMDWYENWARGRAECGAQIRASIVEDALEKDILNAKIYIDKIIGGDQVTDKLQVNVTNTQLENVSTEDLLEVMFKQQDNDE